jgi:hypothetical protein
VQLLALLPPDLPATRFLQLRSLATHLALKFEGTGMWERAAAANITLSPLVAMSVVLARLPVFCSIRATEILATVTEDACSWPSARS